MINRELIDPKSIVVIGGSNDRLKPGGSALQNLLQGSFAGKLYVVNPRDTLVQGVKTYASVESLPFVELAIIAIAAKYCLETIRTLLREKGTKAFIIYSAGFSEETSEGGELERQFTKLINDAGASLIGPNCIGIMNANHQSLFTRPIPHIYKKGIDIVSSSGGTATYIIESAMRVGLRFNSVWSIGNAAQNGVEDILEYMDETFDINTSSTVKLLYIETIKDPDRLLKYATSLIKKGCQIAAIKSGTTESGSRAASSHTGAIANSDLAVEALFRKAGIIRCFSREELANVGAVLSLQKLNGRNLAIISHAGGPAVILTDALSKGKINVPEMPKELAQNLKKMLLAGSAVSNPIDILGTGTGEHLGIAIDYCIQHFDEIDAIAVIYGNPGVNKVYEAYEILDAKIKTSPIPIYPILPSVITAVEETDSFVRKGHVNFTDECVLATALSRVVSVTTPATFTIGNLDIDIPSIRSIIDNANDGYLEPSDVRKLFKAAGITCVEEFVSNCKTELLSFTKRVGYPIVMKCVGPIHKSDVGGVVLNVKSDKHLLLEFERLMSIPNTYAVMLQPMISGRELFIGAKYEPRFGHIVLCGLGGIFVEVLQDVASGLAPLSFEEARSMVRSLRAYKIIKGTRGQEGVNEDLFVEIIVRLSILLRSASEIKELDINPLLANKANIVTVDARVRIEK